MNKPKNNDNSPDRDNCETPPHAIEPLLPYIPKDWIIWESAYGSSMLLVKAFRERGYTVIASEAGDDFFKYFPATYTIQVTNPPFSKKYAWLERSFELSRPFALLLPYESTFAGRFQKLFRAYNNKPWRIQVLSPERRINFKMPRLGWGKYVEKNGKRVWKATSAQMPTMWLTWGLEVDQNEYLETFYVPMRKVEYTHD